MKYVFPALVFFLQACSSTKKTAAPTVFTPPVIIADTIKVDTPVFANLRDSASYAMGIFLINFYRQQGVTDINPQMVAKAIEDAQAQTGMKLTDAEANMAIMACINEAQMAKSKGNIEACDKFMAENKGKPGVTTTASGLQYEILRAGTGPIPKATDSVVCHYKGTFLNGEIFDESYARNEPVTFSVSGVVRGWTEVLQLMPTGSKWKVYVPYQLGYGTSDYYAIPGGSLLIFELELLEVKTKH